MISRIPTLTHILIVSVLIGVTGCIPKSENEVVVYSALDREFSEPILQDVERELSLTIRPKYDQESNKTVGLVTSLIQNQSKPQADLFWNNEILHTLRLEKLGLLDVYRSPEAENFPATFVSQKDRWHGFAARARVLLVNKELLPTPADWPNSFEDLADPKWKGKCTMARPLFGTTATHAAVLYSELGPESAKKLLAAISENAVIQGGNKQVAQKVARGEFLFGITDTDDAIIEVENGEPVAIVFPDQADNQPGTLLIPNTLGLIKNGPNTERAKRLIDRLLKPDIEERLAQGASAQIPLNRKVETRSRVQKAGQAIKPMEVDFRKAADCWDEAAKFLEAQFPVGG